MKLPIEILREKLPRVYHYLLDWRDENIDKDFYPIPLKKSFCDFTTDEIFLLWVFAYSQDGITLRKKLEALNVYRL